MMLAQEGRGKTACNQVEMSRNQQRRGGLTTDFHTSNWSERTPDTADRKPYAAPAEATEPNPTLARQCPFRTLIRHLANTARDVRHEHANYFGLR